MRLKGFVSSGDQAWIVQGVGERRTLLPIGADIAGGADRWGLVAIATPDLTLAALDDALAALAT
ncbi:MAG: GTP-binding protein [Acidimicrobiales bacterium]